MPYMTVSDWEYGNQLLLCGYVENRIDKFNRIIYILLCGQI